jgi:hypothetical protein
MGTSPELIKLGQQFIWHHQQYKYPIALVAYETGQSSRTIAGLINRRYPGPSQRTANVLQKFMDTYNEDLLKFKHVKISEVLLESIRILHLGQRFENALKRGDIYTIQDVVLKSKKEVTDLTRLGAKSLSLIDKLLSRIGLKIGMDISHIWEASTTMTVDVSGTRGQVQAAIHSMTRHIRNRMDVDSIDIKLKANPIDDPYKNKLNLHLTEKGKGKQQKALPPNRYPFITQFRIICGERKMEAINKKFRSGGELAAFLESVAARVRPIKDIKTFEDSDLWVIEI